MDIDLIEKKIRELQILLGPGGSAAHAALTGSAAHGAVSAPTPNQIITRDAAGRAQIVAPSVAEDIARKDTVDSVQTNLTTHAALTNPHSATAAATADRLMLRDGSGRAAVATPSVAGDIATKGYVDGVTGTPTGAIAMWGTATPPTGWLICDGSAISETTYAALFAIIGHSFGGDPGGGNFNLPNFTNKIPRGGTVGATGGSDTHSHALGSDGAACIWPVNGRLYFTDAAGASFTPGHYHNTTGYVAYATPTAGIPLAGSTNSANDIPAYLSVKFIIKT